MCGDHHALSLRRGNHHSQLATGPGIHRLLLGEATVVVLCDGHFLLSTPEVLRGDTSPLDGLLARAGLEELVPSHVNAFLIDTGDKRILIDAGAGDLQGSTLGDMARRLLAAGYSVGDIDTVLVTHLHPDHIGGLTRSGEAVFERARIHVSRAEAAFWLERGSADGVDGSVRATFADARKVLAPYIATDRLRLFDAQASWHGCINALALPGHTHGHTGFRLRTGKQDVLFCGDLFHVAAVQLADPGVTVCYDSEPAQAKATRVAFLKEAAHRGDCIAAAHAPFPGLGIVCREGDGYVWQPAA